MINYRRHSLDEQTSCRANYTHLRFRFAPQVVSGPQMTYAYVSDAQLHGGMPASNAQPLNTVHYAQPIAYAEPQVQVVAVRNSSWRWSDLALLAVAGAIVGAAITRQSQGSRDQKSVVELVEEADEEVALAIVTALVLASETKEA